MRYQKLCHFIVVKTFMEITAAYGKRAEQNKTFHYLTPELLRPLELN
jgi:hypothetical protein